MIDALFRRLGVFSALAFGLALSVLGGYVLISRLSQSDQPVNTFHDNSFQDAISHNSGALTLAREPRSRANVKKIIRVPEINPDTVERVESFQVQPDGTGPIDVQSIVSGDGSGGHRVTVQAAHGTILGGRDIVIPAAIRPDYHWNAQILTGWNVDGRQDYGAAITYERSRFSATAGGFVRQQFVFVGAGIRW